MFRYAISVLALVSYPLSALAQPNIPSWCCPSTCQVIDGSTDTITSIEERGPTASSRNEKTIPYSKNLFLGDAPDGLSRACIGFDAFGDPEIKCLFSPLPLI